MLWVVNKKNALKKRKDFEYLKSEGKVINKKAIKLIYALRQCEAQNANYKIGFKVTKRLFSRAVDRNVVRRRMKEALRKEDYILQEKDTNDKELLVLFVYNSKSLLDILEIKTTIHHLVSAIKLH